MSDITYLPYGGVNFRKLPIPELCGIESVWCQYVEQGDTFKAQIIMGETANVVENGDFQNETPQDNWTGIGWIIETVNGDNRMKHVPGTVFGLRQDGILTAVTMYKCTFTISSRTVGTLTLSGNPNGVATVNGDYEFYFRTFAPQTWLAFSPSTDFDGSIDDITCVQIQEDITAVVLDSDDLVVHTFGALVKNQFENHLRIEQDWADFALEDGCYSVAITNDSFIVDDQFINNSAGWALDANLVITTVALAFTPVGLEVADAVLEDVLTDGCTYQVIFEIGGININHNIRVILGTQEGTTQLTVGVKTETIVSNGTDLTIRFENTDPLALTTTFVNYITIQKTSIDAVSDCFDLQETWECSKLFKWQNVSHWGGYSFEEFEGVGRFEHRLRHIVNFKGGTYPRDIDFRVTSDGNNNLDYALMRKHIFLGVSAAKSYIHDAIAAFFSHDTSSIDDINYVSEDDYDTTPAISDKLTGRIEIDLKKQNLTNTKL